MATEICKTVASLEQLGYQVIKIGSAKELVDKLAAGQRFEIVFHCCANSESPEMAAQIPTLLSIYQINCVTLHMDANEQATAVSARISEVLAHHQPRKPHVAKRTAMHSVK